MATWCVYHMIHVRTPYQYLPQLVIREVPEEEKVSKDLLERAGYQFGEFNIPWANHSLEEVSASTSPGDLVYRIREGFGEQTTWAKLQEAINAPL